MDLGMLCPFPSSPRSPSCVPSVLNGVKSGRHGSTGCGFVRVVSPLLHGWLSDSYSLDSIVPPKLIPKAMRLRVLLFPVTKNPTQHLPTPSSSLLFFQREISRWGILRSLFFYFRRTSLCCQPVPRDSHPCPPVMVFLNAEAVRCALSRLGISKSYVVYKYACEEATLTFPTSILLFAWRPPPFLLVFTRPLT